MKQWKMAHWIAKCQHPEFFNVSFDTGLPGSVRKLMLIRISVDLLNYSTHFGSCEISPKSHHCCFVALLSDSMHEQSDHTVNMRPFICFFWLTQSQFDVVYVFRSTISRARCGLNDEYACIKIYLSIHFISIFLRAEQPLQRIPRFASSINRMLRN